MFKKLAVGKSLRMELMYQNFPELMEFAIKGKPRKNNEITVRRTEKQIVRIASLKKSERLKRNIRLEKATEGCQISFCSRKWFLKFHPLKPHTPHRIYSDRPPLLITFEK